MQAGQVTAKDIEVMFDRIEAALKQPLRLIVIGGGAMALRGEKAATKDIDIVLENLAGYKRLVRALVSLGFIERPRPEPVYRAMQTTVYTHPDGYWLDLFVTRVCGTFLVHRDMVARAEVYRRSCRLSVVLLAREDIFLAKSFTERVGDLDDMAVLYRRGLDRRTILDEVVVQSKHAPHGQVWESFLAVKLAELEERFDITVPFRKAVERMAVKRLSKKGK